MTTPPESPLAWKAAARHWWERMREAERERDVLRAECAQMSEELGLPPTMRPAEGELRRMREGWAAARETIARLERERDEARSALGPLARRIDEADAKHPRSAEDGTTGVLCTETWLRTSREDLRRNPSWHAALKCELAEMLVELAAGNTDRLADELLDVATVAMRWRRDVLERGMR